MKKLILSLAFIAFYGVSSAQTKAPKQTVFKNQIVEAACGECQFKLKGKDCDLAVRINGVAYFVDGSKIDDHGDAHGKHGFCNAVRKAEVSGTIVGGRFKSTSFKLMPEVSPKS